MSRPLSLPTTFGTSYSPMQERLQRAVEARREKGGADTNAWLADAKGDSWSARMMRPTQAETEVPSVLDLMIDKVDEVNRMQGKADGMVNQLLTGGDVSSTEVLTAVQKADMAFRTMLQVRNKLIEAYREILQIQI